MPGIMSRIQTVMGGVLSTTYGPTGTHREQLEIAEREFQAVQPRIRQAVEVDLAALKARLDELDIRWTAGRDVPSLR